MINLNELSSRDLAKILRLRQKMEVHAIQIARILKTAEKKQPPVEVSSRHMRLPRGTQPDLRSLITGILETAGTPMSVPEIYEASLKTGYLWRSQEPINALNVKMYTDKTFKKASPGRFVLRNKRKTAAPTPSTPT